MQENVVATVEQPVVSVSKTEGTIDNVDMMEKDFGSCQDASSDLETDSSGQEKIPSADTDNESGKWVKNVKKLRGIRMTRCKSVFVYRLDDSVTMDMMHNHLVSNRIKGGGGNTTEDVF